MHRPRRCWPSSPSNHPRHPQTLDWRREDRETNRRMCLVQTGSCRVKQDGPKGKLAFHLNFSLHLDRI
jgi:hypothetical protein